VGSCEDLEPVARTSLSGPDYHDWIECYEMFLQLANDCREMPEGECQAHGESIQPKDQI